MTPARTVYAAGADGYDTFRIPAIVAVPDGTLLAFAEGRRLGPGDAGPIDLVLRRSADRGDTWSALQVVASDPGNTVGNPSPVVDPASGDVVLLTTRAAGSATEDRIVRGEVPAAESRRVWLQRSADHGLSWTAAVDLTTSTKRPDWRWYATGPGHAIALRQGPHAGRLVVPANHSTGAAGHGGHLLLSDDGGRSWRIGAEDHCPPEQHQSAGWCVHANESTVAELPDGRIYANTRNQGGLAPAHRAQTVSSDGGETFDRPYAPVLALATPVVQCSLLAVDGQLVFAGPGDPEVRRRLTVRSSRDAGRSFPEEVVVSPGPAAYSDLVDLGRHNGERTIGVLFENGDHRPYERISFTHLALP
ncbi:sialidase family protein [Actinopolymorpha sp. B17G11]|uniref:sialidase family protein n=1 Tax=Actinopolymorpha sp. B17G11 TaxID=3160861 RepID=UPI0032E4957B